MQLALRVVAAQRAREGVEGGEQREQLLQVRLREGEVHPARQRKAEDGLSAESGQKKKSFISGARRGGD